MEQNQFYIIIGLIVAGFGAVIYFLTKNQAPDNSNDTALKMMNENLGNMHSRLDATARAFGGMQTEIGKMTEISRSITDLQNLFRNPKLRGNIGEQMLSQILEQSIPREYYKMQHKFKNGETVDAIVKTSQGIIPIDAKFPMENFNKLANDKTEEVKQATRDFIKDVKKKIDDISIKYILPEEKTLDFALMYVPSEAVYYDLISKHESVVEYAKDKRVLLSSPNSFYYFLRVILMGIEGQRLEESSKQLLNAIKDISNFTTKFGNNIGVLSRHITNSKNSMDQALIDFDKLALKIENAKLLKETEKKKELPKETEN